jgi:hypothetical protein
MMYGLFNVDGMSGKRGLVGITLDATRGSGLARAGDCKSARKFARRGYLRERTLLQNDYCAQDVAQTISGFSNAKVNSAVISGPKGSKLHRYQ